MGRKATSIIPVADDGKQESTDLVRREPTEEELVFQRFCDCVDAHMKWRGQPPIASNDAERRERAMLYMLKSIEAYRWFTELVGGLDVLEKLLASTQKRNEIADASRAAEQMVRKRPRFVVRVDREDAE